MSSEKLKLVEAIEKDLEQLTQFTAAKKYADLNELADALVVKSMSALLGNPVQDSELAWQEFRPTKLSARHYCIPLALIAYKVVAVCNTTKLFPILESLAKLYIAWREEARSGAGKNYSKATVVDSQLCNASVNLLLSVRPENSELVPRYLATLKIVLSLIKSRDDFGSNPDAYFKIVAYSSALHKNEPKLLVPFFQSLNLLSADNARAVLYKGVLSYSTFYFRCLALYSCASSRAKQFTEADKALQTWTTTFNEFSKNQLSASKLCLSIEGCCLQMATLTRRWHGWQASQSEATQSTLENQLSAVLGALRTLTEVVSGTTCKTETEFKDQWPYFTRLTAQTQEWLEESQSSLMPPSGSPSVPSSTKKLMRSSYMSVASLYDALASHESKTSSKERSGVNWNAEIPHLLGYTALISLPLQEYDAVDKCFADALAFINKRQNWSAMRPLYQKAHRVAEHAFEQAASTGYAKSPLMPHAIKWITLACSINNEYMEKCPSDAKAAEEQTGLRGVLAAFQRRAASSATPQPSAAGNTSKTSTSTKSAPSMAASMTTSATPAISTFFKNAQWTLVDAYPLLEKHVSAQLQLLSADPSSGISSFFSYYSPYVTSDRQEEFVALVDVEANYYLSNRRPAPAKSLFSMALSLSQLDSPLLRSKLLVGKAKSVVASCCPTRDYASASSDLNEALTTLISSITDGKELSEAMQDTTPATSRILAQIALVQTTRILMHYEVYSSSNSTPMIFSGESDTLESVLSLVIDLYSNVMARMLATAGAKALLDQNRSHWLSFTAHMEALSQLRDFLFLHENFAQYIAVNKLLLKMTATLEPYSPATTHAEHYRRLLYTQIGSFFHQLGYDEPLAAKYMSKSGAVDEQTLVNHVEANEDRDPAIISEDAEWLSSVLIFYHDTGRLTAVPFWIAILETHAESLEIALDAASAVNYSVARLAFMRSMRAQLLYASAHIKASLGRIDEAVIDALIALQLRAPQPSSSSATSPSNAIPPPPYWKPTSGRLTKLWIESMVQLANCYKMQGNLNEARFYLNSAHMQASNFNAKAVLDRVVIIQSELASGSKPLDTASADSSFDLLDKIRISEATKANLIKTSALYQAGNAALRIMELDKATTHLKEAEECLSALIDASYVQELEQAGELVADTKAKTTKARGAAKKTAAIPYRLSLSPSKLPSATSDTPNDYLGLKIIQLRIQMMQATIDYHRGRQVPQDDVQTASALFDASLASLIDVHAKLAQFDSCSALSMDLALNLLQQAKVMMAKLEREDAAKVLPFGSAWGAPLPTSAPLSTPASVTAKKSRAKSTAATKKTASTSPSTTTLATVKSMLEQALTLSASAGSISKVTSEICQYLVQLTGIIDPSTTILRQNSAIGITLRHQMLTNIYRQGVEAEPEPEIGGEKDVIDEITKAFRNELSLDGEDDETGRMRGSLKLLDFTEHKMDADAFNKTFLEVMGRDEQAKDYTVCTLSLGPEGRSLIISRLRFNEEPVVCRVDLERPLDEASARSFREHIKIAASLPEEPEEPKTAALSRSSTSITPSSMTASDPSLRRTTSSVASMAKKAQASRAKAVGLRDPEAEKESRSGAKTTKAKRSTSASSVAASTSTAAKAKSSKALKESSNDVANKLADLLKGVAISKGEDLNDDECLSSRSSSPPPSSDLSVLQEFQKEFNAIIAYSDSTAVNSRLSETSLSSNAVRENWWAKRWAVNARLGSWASNFEDSILAPYKSMLLGKLTDNKLEKALDAEAFAKHIESLLQVPAGRINITFFKLLVQGIDGMSNRDLMEALRVLVNWKPSEITPAELSSLHEAAQYLSNSFSRLATNDAYKIKQAQLKSQLLMDFEEQFGDDSSEPSDSDDTDTTEVSRQLRHPVILILDKNLHQFPWESLPILRPVAVSRMPSIFHLRAQLLSRVVADPGSPNVLRDGIDANQVAYIVNPSQDLKDMESEMKPLVERNEKWSGLIGRQPTATDFVSALESKQLLLYCGHESGVQYIQRSADVRQAKAKNGGCVVWLMGCASVRLTDNADFDPSGMVYTYLASGCPSVVGNLWSVTSRDLDLETKSLLSWLTPSKRSSAWLPEAVRDARRQCKLDFINGAALVTYGLPVKVKQRA